MKTTNIEARQMMGSDMNSHDNRDNDVSMNAMEKDREMLEENDLECSELRPKGLVRRLNPCHHTFIFNSGQLKSGKNCKKDLLHQSIFFSDATIPKHMVTLDEQYLRRCLELIHINGSKTFARDNFVNLKFTDAGYFSGYSNRDEIQSGQALELASLVLECPSPAGNGSVVISPAGHWIPGSIMGSQSMVNILNSPWLRKLGVLEDDAYSKGMGLNDVKRSISCDFTSSPGRLSYDSTQKPGNETLTLQNHKYGSDTAHERFVSLSSTNSTCSDQSSSTSASPSVTHGVLQCIWKGGVPQFIFSMDDQRESYVANLRTTDFADDKALDFEYLFYSRKDGQKESESHGMQSQLVSKMKISTSFTVGPNNSKIMEREFVLFGGNDKFWGENPNISHNSKKNKGLSKVVKVLKMSHSSKPRTSSKFRGFSGILENYSMDSYQVSSNESDVCGVNLLDNELPPNLQLAAILVKERLLESQEVKVGGWGMKFLKKVGVKQTASKSSLSNTCNKRNSSDCSSSMDIIVPAGLHGGPFSMHGGPSCLIERWRSGGQCDCGGWDLGCPLTVLTTKEETLPQADMEECCRFIDLFIQGSEHGAPTLRVVNVRDGLYFVHFQSTLSALQSFSIAVAYIHSQSPNLRPKNVEEGN